MREPANLVFWHPVLSGAQHLQQFLRIRTAGAMIGAGAPGGETTRQLRDRLASGENVEVAGYMLSRDTAIGLEGAMLVPPVGGGSVNWFEVAGAGTAELSPAMRQAVAKWRDGGWNIESATFQGPAFWQTQEIEEVPQLVHETVRCLRKEIAG
jgi:exosortase A-associated hydrolase 2